MWVVEEGCYEGCYQFPSPNTRRSFLSGCDVWKDQELFDDTWGEVILLSGLTGTGKDTYAHVRIVYLETDWQTLIKRNSSRKAVVPQYVMESMMGKLVLPEAYEAQNVEWLPV